MRLKKILTITAITLVVIIGVLVAIPFLFKDKIIAAVKTAANQSLTATLDFRDVNISVFRHFPQLSVGLEGLEITNGPGPFEGVKLVKCERLDVTVDLFTAISGDNISIKGLYFDKPEIKVYALSNGDANYDITKPVPEAAPAAESSGAIKLEYYEITDGKILYDDRSLEMIAELEGVQHSGSGNFAGDLYDFVMETDADKLSVNYGGVQYLSKAKAYWKATLGMDMKNMKFTFRENEMKVNDLDMSLDGFVQMPDNTEDIIMDLKFGTPANTFKSLLSIVPGAYTQDFNGVQANGTIKFEGFAKGVYNETTYPAFKLHFLVGNADFKYPALPLGVSDINVDANINSPTSSMNDMTINIPKFGLKIGSNPLEGYFNLKTPESDPTVDTRVSGVLNLGELSKAFPMEGIQELSGIIRSNMTIRAAMSQIDAGQYDQVDMSGEFGMSGITYRASDMPTVKINNLATSLTPQRLDIQDFDAILGKSDLRASGSIDNLLAYFSTTKTMTGKMNFSSGYFDANEWMEEETTGEVVPSDVPAEEEAMFDRWDLVMDGKIGKLKYDVYDITNLSAAGHFTPNKMNISGFGLTMNGNSDLSGNGEILNAWNYLFDNQTVKGVINLNSSYFDLDPFMAEDPAATAAAKTEAPPVEEIIPVPENMDMTINAKMAKVKYTDYHLNNLNGQIVVKDRVAKLQDCTASIMGGQVGLNGEYNTSDLSKPSFNMDFALLNMGFRDAFQSFATVKALAPAMQLMEGKFNTTLSMSGLLGKDMMPDFTTLSAAGFLETIAAGLNNFKPLAAVGEKLGLDYLQKVEIKDTRNWFEIKDGNVLIKPFNTRVRDVAMQIGGTYGLSKDMNFTIMTKTPRSALQKSTAGAAVNSGLSFLSGEASKLGVNIAQGEYINVQFDLTGSIANPKVVTKVLGSDGQSTISEQATSIVSNVAEKAKDTLATLANKELDKAKEKAKEAADKAADSLRNIANKKVQEVTEQAKDKLGKEVGDKLGKEAEKVLGDQGQKKIDEVKNKLDKWDPFKKKKQDN